MFMTPGGRQIPGRHAEACLFGRSNVLLNHRLYILRSL
jgi:hypothetical protein